VGLSKAHKFEGPQGGTLYVGEADGCLAFKAERPYWGSQLIVFVDGPERVLDALRTIERFAGDRRAMSALDFKFMTLRGDQCKLSWRERGSKLTIHVNLHNHARTHVWLPGAGTVRELRVACEQVLGLAEAEGGQQSATAALLAG